MDAVINRAKCLGLDFDDAYQYVTLVRYNLTIISFDNDFDRTERGRKHLRKFYIDNPPAFRPLPILPLIF